MVVIWTLIDWLIDWSTDWSIDQLTDWLINWWIDGLIDWLMDWLMDWLIDWLIDWFMDWLIDWLIDWCELTGVCWFFFLQELSCPNGCNLLNVDCGEQNCPSVATCKWQRGFNKLTFLCGHFLSLFMVHSRWEMRMATLWCAFFCLQAKKVAALTTPASTANPLWTTRRGTISSAVMPRVSWPPVRSRQSASRSTPKATAFAAQCPAPVCIILQSMTYFLFRSKMLIII